MAYRKMMTIITVVLLVTVVSGCGSGSRKHSAQLRWERTMDQARVEAARQSFEEGRLVYAERVLKECRQCSDPKSPLAGEAQQILAKVQLENERYAAAGQLPQSIEDMTY